MWYLVSGGHMTGRMGTPRFWKMGDWGSARPPAEPCVASVLGFQDCHQLSQESQWSWVVTSVCACISFQTGTLRAAGTIPRSPHTLSAWRVKACRGCDKARCTK